MVCATLYMLRFGIGVPGSPRHGLQTVRKGKREHTPTADIPQSSKQPRLLLNPVRCKDSPARGHFSRWICALLLAVNTESNNRGVSGSPESCSCHVFVAFFSPFGRFHPTMRFGVSPTLISVQHQ